MKGDYFLPALLYMTCWILCWCYFSNTQVHNGLPDRPEDRHAAYTAVIQPLFPQGRRGTVRILVRMGNQTRHGRNCLHQVLQVNYQVKTCHGKTSNFWTRLAFWTIIFESVSLTQNWNATCLKSNTQPFMSFEEWKDGIFVILLWQMGLNEASWMILFVGAIFHKIRLLRILKWKIAPTSQTCNFEFRSHRAGFF